MGGRSSRADGKPDQAVDATAELRDTGSLEGGVNPLPSGCPRGPPGWESVERSRIAARTMLCRKRDRKGAGRVSPAVIDRGAVCTNIEDFDRTSLSLSHEYALKPGQAKGNVGRATAQSPDLTNN